MKQLLLIATFLVASLTSAQATDNEKLLKLIEILTDRHDEKVLDSVSIELNKLSTSENAAVKLTIPTVRSLITDIRVDNSNKVPAKEFSTVSKEDLKGFKINEDKFKEIVFIKPKMTYKIYAYLGIKKGFLNLRLVNEYSGKNWIFWKKAIFLYDGKRFKYEDEAPETDVYSGGISERSDKRFSIDQIDQLRELCKSEKVDVRLEASKGVHDFELTRSIKESILKNFITL